MMLILVLPWSSCGRPRSSQPPGTPLPAVVVPMSLTLRVGTRTARCPEDPGQGVGRPTTEGTTTTIWKYPDPDHPATLTFPWWREARKHRCPRCGAPADAHCITRRGSVYNGVHSARARATA